MKLGIGLSLVAALASATLAASAIACGTERWPVKTGADRDASKVTIAPETTTIAHLTEELRAPPNPKSRNSSRFAPTELSTYQVTGVLTVVKKEADEDYHLVIVAADDTEQTMIVESPSPTCAKGSLFEQQIKDVRAAIDAKFGPIQHRRTPNISVTVTGVAFFDPLHGQEGVAANGIELHPLLDISFP